MTIRDNDVKIVVYICRFILYLALIYLMFKEKIDVSILVLIVSYHEYLVTYINDLIDSTAAIREVNTSVNRINDILNYNSYNINYGVIDTKDIHGIVELKNVSLKIKDKEILKNINLKIDHNEVVALVGEAGCGKTMIFNLLLRLFEPTKGKITLDNIDIFDFSKEVYSNNVSVVNQKPFIFDMSIRENLNLVDSNHENQIKACKRVGIHDYIMSLKDGYNTKMISDAENISSGQKQLIALARTLLSNSEVLLFDEVTSSLDMQTSKQVMKVLKDLKKDHTILMITHKPQLMKIADDIIVIDHGKLVGRGTHKELIKENKYYQTLQK